MANQSLLNTSKRKTKKLTVFQRSWLVFRRVAKEAYFESSCVGPFQWSGGEGQSEVSVFLQPSQDGKRSCYRGCKIMLPISVNNIWMPALTTFRTNLSRSRTLVMFGGWWKFQPTLCRPREGGYYDNSSHYYIVIALNILWRIKFT